MPAGTSFHETTKPQRPATDRLQETVRRLHAARTMSTFPVGRDWYLHAGYETRNDPAEYAWDGEKRGGDPQHPYFIWQYTLAGCGAFDEGAQTFALPPSTAMTVTVPSAHRYYLPHPTPAEPRPSWTFFWVTFHHDYIASRLRERIRTHGSIISAEPDSRLVTRAVSLFEIWAQGRGDAFTEEGALFDFLLEYERTVDSSTFVRDERERWLEDAKGFVLQRLEHVVDVDELAAQHGMSRSYYSHRFSERTGRSPARWILQVRLEEATRRLVHTEQKLDAIARATGLQNANHLCKVFRRHFHLSPGEFRRQMR